MRIWSKKLITSGVLPTKQLKAMRYELGDMIKQYPNIKHPLVKFANNYDIWYLYTYFTKVTNEYEKRMGKVYIDYNLKITNMFLSKTKLNDLTLLDDDITFIEDNADYLKICYWNLYEKAIREVITNEEWQKIEDLIGGEIE